ncbi:unnamed protein product [Schistosoma mattheei]|uniref:Uncharacterized protein n=1 Tax=Schistosoma mattheei TaxID=31246 RepID=A0AA85BCZ3_9TREM|nr:unnamed protein product [Schistosoma mattheei]
MWYRPPTSILQPTLSWAFVSSSIQCLFIFPMSISISRRYVFFGLPLLLWPSGSHMRARLVTQLDAFLNVCPIHFQRFFLISSSAVIWFVLLHSKLLLIVSGQRNRSTLRREPLISTCIFWIMAFVILHVSTPYSRTVLTFVLRFLTLVLVDSCFKLQIFFSCKYATHASPIRAFTSASRLVCSSMILPKYVKNFHIFQIFSVNCDSIVACCVVLKNHVTTNFLYWLQFILTCTCVLVMSFMRYCFLNLFNNTCLSILMISLSFYTTVTLSKIHTTNFINIQCTTYFFIFHIYNSVKL